MIRIYYDETGHIAQKFTGTGVAGLCNLPYIDLEQDIKINEWRVDTATLTLVAQEPEPEPTR